MTDVARVISLGSLINVTYRNDGPYSLLTKQSLILYEKLTGKTTKRISSI